jgi:peptide/nickel transport system permease protein
MGGSTDPCLGKGELMTTTGEDKLEMAVDEVAELALDAVPTKTVRSRDYRIWFTGFLLVIVFGFAILGIVIQLVPSLKHLYLQQTLILANQPPLTPGHFFGTDNLGRDLAWRIIGGLGVSMLIGVGVSIISIILGLVVGILAGFYGRIADGVSTVVVDLTWAFPAILLAIVFAGVMGPGLPPLILALALTGWASFARIVRGEVLSLRERDYIAAARVLGVSKFRISIRHLLPSLWPVTIVMAVYFVSTSIVGEAGLSFLGLGAKDPMPSLGIILELGSHYWNQTFWPIVLGGAVLSISVLLLNSLGDQLRDRLDPRKQR